MKYSFFIFAILACLMSCGDSDSIYVTSIDNKTDFEIVVRFSNDSSIVCVSNQETIIEEYWGGSIKKMSCFTPYIFYEDDADIIIDDGAKILIKDILDDDSWSCTGEEGWSLIMVGSYIIRSTTTLIISDEDIQDAPH